MHLDASGASGGILTAWNNDRFHLNQSVFKDRSVSVLLECCTSNTSFWITNIYVPNFESDRDAFVQDLFDIHSNCSGPWAIAGDFNTVRSADDRNSGQASVLETQRFNNWLRDMQVQELPILDRNFTWSNMQSHPILTRIDTFFFNSNWDLAFPNSTLHSMHRCTSDHFPLKIEASTQIPKSCLFRYENNWNFSPFFRNPVHDSWTNWFGGTDMAAILNYKLKNLRKEIKIWKKNCRPINAYIDCCKFTLSFLDWLEEGRPLSFLEFFFRGMVKEKLQFFVHASALAAWQRGKIIWCVLGDEDTRFYHSRASARLRGNKIKVIHDDGACLFSHQAKQETLTKFYRDLMGVGGLSSYDIEIESLYENQVNLASLTQPFPQSEIVEEIRN